MSEISEINETLKKIESKIEDKSPFSWTKLIDFEKTQENSRKDREEKRSEEILKLQKAQADSIKNQENFNKIIAFTGAIVALTTIYTFIAGSFNLKNNPPLFWVITAIFFILIAYCFDPLIVFIFKNWKGEDYE